MTLLAVAALLAVPIMRVEAKEDSISYSFKLKPYYGEDSTGFRYRQTLNVNNCWKVDLAYSSEGAGTKATFFLGQQIYIFGLKIASEPYTIKQGTGAHYYPSYVNGLQTNVVLSAENNNYTANTYNVSGYWDEEVN